LLALIVDVESVKFAVPHCSCTTVSTSVGVVGCVDGCSASSGYLSFVYRKTAIKHDDAAAATVLAADTEAALCFDGEVWIDIVLSANIYSVDVDVSTTATC
jgi:hypothetical protein